MTALALKVMAATEREFGPRLVARRDEFVAWLLAASDAEREGVLRLCELAWLADALYATNDAKDVFEFLGVPPEVFDGIAEAQAGGARN